MYVMYVGMCVLWHIYGGEELRGFHVLLHLYVGFRDWTQVVRHVQQAPLSFELFHQPGDDFERLNVWEIFLDSYLEFL